MQTVKKETYGFSPKSEQAAELVDRIYRINWFSAVGYPNADVEREINQFTKLLNVKQLNIEWVSLKDLPETISTFNVTGSDVWEVLYHLPDRIAEESKWTGRMDIIDDLVYHMPELVYVKAFDKAFTVFKDEKTVAFVSTHVMYVSVLACIWEALSDRNGWTENPFTSIITILEAGYFPIGPSGSKFLIC
ncbi:hypothetical protein [Bacillus sp. FJAT-44742]|uniref:hypothetical protein n=1 Tax=Bacillus sp. FJAT-44742 TaxID=2014005 RepID=UPI000C232826|nr:hypothetical protein [Bacillus sp. FJAT-44742]